MKVAALVLLLVATPACGLLDKLLGDDESTASARPKPGEPIAFEQLVLVLPAMDGWETRRKEGKSTQVGGDAVTLASAKYEKTFNDKVQAVKLEVMDGNYVSSVYSPFAVMAHSQGPIADAHKMQIEIAGHPGMEEWKTEAGTVQVLLLVARRFVVTLQGENIPPGLVRQTIEAMDLAKLTAWAEASRPSSAD
jgi:hypothetical protein